MVSLNSRPRVIKEKKKYDIAKLGPESGPGFFVFKVKVVEAFQVVGLGAREGGGRTVNAVSFTEVRYQHLAPARGLQTFVS